jgi:hypothetical protein
MKKIILSVALLASVLATKAQDTSCTYFQGKTVYEFDYQTSEITGEDEQTTRFYEVNLKYGDVLCIHLSDEKQRVRKVITTFFDGTTSTQVLDSKDNVYYTNLGVTKVLVGRPYIAIKL